MPHPIYGKIGLLNNGGGSKGAWQAGALCAWKDHGINYDSIYGASVGSLNGLLVHQGDYDKMLNLWMSIKNSDVYNWNPLRLLNSLYDSKPLLNLIKSVVDIPKLRANPNKFHISSTNFSTWDPYLAEISDLKDDEIPQMLWASASPPIYFPPVTFRGQTLVDAGVLNNYCISEAINNDMDTLVVLSFANSSPRVPNNIFDCLAETLSVATYGYFKREIESVTKINQVIKECSCINKEKSIKLVIIKPDKALDIPLLDFSYKNIDRKALFESGYNLARKVLQDELPF